MADDTHLVETLPEEVDAGEGVVLEVFRGAADYVSGGLSETAVVVAEGSYSGAGQGVGNHGKGLVLKDFLVTVLEAAAGDHDQYGSLAGTAFRQHQRPLQHCVSVGEGYLLHGIRERALGRLGSVQFFFAGSERQRERNTHLLEGAHDLLKRPLPLIGGADGGNFDGEVAGFRPAHLDGNALGSLVRRIHGGIRIIQMEDQ